MKQKLAMLANASGALAIASALAVDRAQTITPQELAKRQAAGPTRGQRKVVARQASRELGELGERQIVLGHIHPRWLRQVVGVALDDGLSLTGDDIARLRELGPGLVRSPPADLAVWLMIK